jgi:hypothetical protein
MTAKHEEGEVTKPARDLCHQIGEAHQGDSPMSPPAKIIKEFPRQGDLQLFRLAELHEFQCVRCQAKKKSKLVAVQGGEWSGLLCNGCYGLLLSHGDQAR